MRRLSPVLGLAFPLSAAPGSERGFAQVARGGPGDRTRRAGRFAGHGGQGGARPMRIVLLCLLTLLPLRPAHAQTQVDLELVLLADATGSIDQGEIEFQRRGYASAITAPDVINAIRSSGSGRIAVTYVEWGDAASQDVVVPWTVIDGIETAAAFANALLPPPRRAFGRNAIGAALLHGKALIEGNGIEGERRVIDISADSANNWNGPPIETARDEVVAAGITINGLAVLCRVCSGRPIAYDLEAAFEERVVGGPGAFVVTADSRETFAGAVRRKLILEIAGTGPSTASAKASPRRSAPG